MHAHERLPLSSTRTFSQRFIPIGAPRAPQMELATAVAPVPTLSAGDAMQFWRMPAGVTVRLVDNAADLAQMEEHIMADADACGIDAEWAPGSANPSAALLQLAFRSAATGDCITLVLVRSISLQRYCSSCVACGICWCRCGQRWRPNAIMQVSSCRGIRVQVQVLVQHEPTFAVSRSQGCLQKSTSYYLF